MALSDRQRLLHDDRIRLRQERPFMIAVRKEKNRFTKEANETYRMFGQVSERVIEGHKQRLRELFEQRYRRVIAVFVRDMRDMKSVNRLMETKQDETIEEILTAYLAAYGLGSVNQIAQTGINDFRAFALSAYGQGFSTQEIERMLRAQLGINAWRSATIARTEVGKLASFTQIRVVEKAALETGAVFKKQWIPFLDERTRVNHSAMQGSEPIPMENKFVVGGESLDRPRDPNGSAGNVINCRCTMKFVEA